MHKYAAGDCCSSVQTLKDESACSVFPVCAFGCAIGSGASESWQSHAPESQDYEEVESITWRKYQIARYFGDKGHYWTSDRRRTALKWVVTIVIGIVVALMGIAVQYSTEWLLILKFGRGACHGSGA
jgi:hypothetical protein